jgi:hypothetical protein
MAKRVRDYKKEYARRVANGTGRGLSRAAARGHPRAGERPKVSSTAPIDPFSREELALRMMRRGSSLKQAAAQHKMSQERLRAYLKDNTVARRVGQRWQIFDRRSRQFPIYSRGRLVTPWMYPDQASEAGRFMEAVKRFLPSGDKQILDPFVGWGVRDVVGKFHPFETDPNTLYELDHRGELVIPEQYRIGNRNA